MLCLFSGILLGLLNILLWVPQTVPCPPCECDCFSELEKLKTHYEKEIARLRVLKIDAHEPSTDVGISQNSSRGSDVSKEAFNASLTASHRLAVLVPFRNRFEEMLEFVPHIHQFLNRQSVEHEVWIMNQADTHRHVFIAS